MKSKKRRFIIFAIVILLACFMRYKHVNKYYNQFINQTTEYYSPGEWVNFDSDYIDYGLCSPGYQIRVDSFEIVETNLFLDRINYDDELSDTLPQKLAVVTITLRNEDSTADGVMLSELALHGYDSIAYLDWNLLTEANPILEGNLGIQLSTGQECTLTLPYKLLHQYYSKSTWSNIEHYIFFLKILKTEKIVVMTENNNIF